MALFRRKVTAEEGLEAVRRELSAPGSKLRDELSVLLSPNTDALREVVEGFPEAAAILDDGRTFALANQRLARLLGRDCVGRTVLEATRSGELDDAAQAALRGELIERELPLPSSQLQVRATLSPLSGERALLVLHDLTASRRMEAMRRDFIANASHELRTPVAAIAGAAETLLGGPLSAADARKFVEMIARHADRLSRLTRDLLDLSRLEAGEFRAALGVVELVPICESCLDLVRDKAREKELVLGFDGPPGLKALADRRAVEQMLVNLLDNAIKYTPRGGRVTLLADGAFAHVILSVIDTGVGIEPRHTQRIFERFYRVDGGRSRDAGGTGLGLAIVKHLALAQNGEVGVDSGSGGSRFWIKLPAAESPRAN
ncbi:MAG TPA: ATP-binding protein [Myxococcales bacterium]|jgi:two-component system phosphate regulon sensor histidine kinase PhoR